MLSDKGAQFDKVWLFSYKDIMPVFAAAGTAHLLF
jgi:hypothetical protein